MKIEIKSWYTGGVLFSVEAGSLRLALEAAVEQRADLRDADLGGADLGGANLRGANLGGANLGGAKNVEQTRLPTGETLAQYIADVVPALCTAGGKPLSEVAAAWDCHAWDNCPMAVAFGVHSLEEVPALYRPRAEQFVHLFDSGLIPKPVVTA